LSVTETLESIESTIASNAETTFTMCSRLIGYLRHFFATEYHRQTLLAARPADPGHPRQIDSQNLAVEKKQSRQRLFVPRCRHLASIGRSGQERLDFDAAESWGMAQPVKMDERVRPADIRVPRP